MKAKNIILPLLLVLLFSLKSFGETTAIKAEVDKLSIFADETLTYKISITSDAKEVPQPQVPEFKDFRVISDYQSSQVSLSAGKLNTNIIYNFILLPAEAGNFKIDSASITIAGNTYSTQSFQIQVKPARHQGLPEPKEKPYPSKEYPSQTKKITL